MYYYLQYLFLLHLQEEMFKGVLDRDLEHLKEEEEEGEVEQSKTVNSMPFLLLLL